MELPDALYDRITTLSERGNDRADEEDWTSAIAVWREALALVPEPTTDWEAGTWLHASIGDGLYELDRLDEARIHFGRALMGPGGMENPFVHLRLGQIAHADKDWDKARDHLLRAYMLDGEDVFEGDGEEHLQFLIANDLV